MRVRSHTFVDQNLLGTWNVAYNKEKLLLNVFMASNSMVPKICWSCFRSVYVFVTKLLTLRKCLRFGTRAPPRCPDLTNSNRVSFSGCVNACRVTCYKGLTKARVVSVNSTTSKLAAISAALPVTNFFSVAGYMKCTAVLDPSLTKYEPSVKTLARFF